MKSTTVAQPNQLVIRKPPLFLILCLAMWSVAIYFAFHHQAMSADIDAAASIVAP